MNQYLTKFKYRNAITEDLWESLGAASGKPVLDVMTTWTKQMGYPVIKVKTQSLNTSVLSIGKKCTHCMVQSNLSTDMPGREHVVWSRQGVGLHSTKTLKLDKGE